jgi:hypothetical protein
VGVSVNLSDSLGTIQGPSAFYTGQVTETTYIAMPDEAGRVTIVEADPRAPADSNSHDVTAGSEVGGLAISECHQVAVFTKGSEELFHAFNLDGGLGMSLSLGHVGQEVHYEPFEEQVIVPYRPDPASDVVPAGPFLRAFTAPRQSVGVAIGQRTEFMAPATLIPQTLATRIALPITCDQ